MVCLQVFLFLGQIDRHRICEICLCLKFESNLDDPNRAVLQKVDGIMGAQGTFSMYIFDNQNGQSDIVSSSLKNSKTWERNEIDKLLQQLQLFADRNNLSRSETYLVDIGSNIGYFSLSAAAAGFQVIAVEAMSVNQFAMRMSICANEEIGLSQAITLIPVALSFQNIHCDLFSAGFNALDGFIRCGSPEQLEALTASTGSIKRQDIEVARLDDVLKDWIPSLAGRVGALKIDTEGLEPFIIQGGPTFLSKVKPAYIQMEVSSMSVDATNVDAVKLLNWMELFGYAVHESADGPRKEPKDITILNPGPQNVFLYAEESVVPS